MREAGTMSYYYYDFDAERQLRPWRALGRSGDVFQLECTFESGEGDWMLLWADCPCGRKFSPEVLSVNGIPAAPAENDFYIRDHGIRYSRMLHTVSGINRISCEAAFPPDWKTEEFAMQLVPLFPDAERVRGRFACPVFPREEYPRTPAPSVEGYRKGAGHKLAPGRFGMLKGDGLLDCAMSRFGKVDKMFLCGHPRWKKPYAWAYSLLQDPAELSLPDEVDVNALRVFWKRGGTTYSYSIASPGIVTENSSGSLKISHLEFAGSYRYVMTAGEVSAPDDFSGGMPENWLLLFGAEEYPDVPLMVMLDRKPARIEFRRLPGGRLSEVVFHGCSRMTTLTPFGFEGLEPETPEHVPFLEDAVSRCRLWSRALLALPVGCREYYRNDYDARKVHIVQCFDYKFFSNEWGTLPLELAPLPPALTLCGQELPEGTADFRFPTKYGYLKGYFSDSSAYSVAMMETMRKYPLRGESPEIPDLLLEDLDEYLEFESRFPSGWQSYAYPGAVLEGYAYGCSMVNFMPEKAGETIRGELRKRLPLACDPERKYTLLKTDHAYLWRTEPDKETVYRYYTDPAMPKMEMFNLYERVEPYTGCRYYLCYFNCCLISGGHIAEGTRKEVLEYPHPFMENDWGVGLTLYLIYTAALASGDFSAVRKQWSALKKIFLYFDVYHDWACMGAGYAEKGWTWIEGANFGAFPAMINMARTVGDQETAESCTYLAAKMLALCEAKYLAGPYFARLYHEKPWYGNRFFQEEYSPACNFQFVPADLSDKRVQPTGISLLTTDAIYPELFESFRKTIPEPHRDMILRYREALLEGAAATNRVEFSYLLLNNTLDETVPEREIREDIELAIRTGRFLREWHDINRFENSLPKNYFKAQLYAWLEMRRHPLWLEHWQDVCIEDARWNSAEGKAVLRIAATGESGMIRCGIRREPERIGFSGGKMSWKSGGTFLLIETAGSGILTLSFGKPAENAGARV